MGMPGNGAKNSLTSADARVLDDAFRSKLADLKVLGLDDMAATSGMTGTQHVAIAEAFNSTVIDKGARFRCPSRVGFAIASTSNTSPPVHA